MVYYNHAFYQYLVSAYRVSFTRVGVIIRQQRNGDTEDVPFATMDVLDCRAVLKYLGERIERLMEALGAGDV